MINSKEIFESIFNFSTEGIIISDTEGNIALANPNAYKLFGYEGKELKNRKIEDLVPKSVIGHHAALREGFAHSPSSRPMGIGKHLFAQKKDGTEFPVEVSLSHFITGGKSYFMSFIIDISIRKNQEDLLSHAHEELKTVNQKILDLNEELESRVEERTEELAIAVSKLAESRRELIHALEKEKQLNELKSRFITTASHEFRTPLGTIISSASLAGKYVNPEDTEKREKHLNRIKSSVHNMTQILNDFLSVEKLDEGLIHNNPEEININDFCLELIEEITPSLKAGQTIIYNHNSDNEIIKIDSNLLKNTLYNLMSNAIKYSPENKEIILSTKLSEKILEIIVKDNGIGISDDEQKFLFDRFFRANNVINIQGTGLGLSIVKKYLELMKGEISFKSKLNEGTEFTIHIKVPKG